MACRLFADCIVQRQRSVDNRAFQLASVRHLGQGRSVYRAGHIGINRLHRRQYRDFHRIDAEMAKHRGRILNDIGFLRQSRCNIHSAVSHTDQAIKPGQFEHRQMA